MFEQTFCLVGRENLRYVPGSRSGCSAVLTYLHTCSTELHKVSEYAPISDLSLAPALFSRTDPRFFSLFSSRY